jgi:signal transduction histidine kinase
VKQPLHVLLVEDSEDDALLLERALGRAGWAPTCERVETEPALRAALAARTFDVVVADWVLPQFSGMAALSVVRDGGYDLPFIVCSGKIDEEMAVSAMRAGAHDFVTKGNLARLGPAVERELREAAARRARRRTEAELEHARAELERSRRLEVAGIVAAQVAHDVGNVLSPLMLDAERVRRHLDRDPAVQRLVERMIRQVRGLSDLNQDLLTLGRRGRHRLEPTDLNAIVREALDGLGDRPPGLELAVALAPDLPRVAAAPGQLARVVSNLVGNARDAMRDAGVLAVRTLLADLREPAGALRAGRHAILEVEDTGSGIPPEQLERIFEPFYSTKKGGSGRGSGLGLAIVQAIVEDHQGAVQVTSEVGRGTKFSVLLPVAAEAAG